LIFEADDFTFKPPAVVSRARRILIKPTASHPDAYPVSTSKSMLATIIKGIRRVSDADILILDGTPAGEPVYPVYQALGYDFPRVLTMDVKDCVWVEVDNPLLKPLAIPTFWVPNVILSSDYLISVAPLKVVKSSCHLSIMNLLSLLPISKYSDDSSDGWGLLYSFDIDKVIADLYFTLPFDLGIVEARKMLIDNGDSSRNEIEEYGKIFIGEPYEVDREVSDALGLKTPHLDLIKTAKVELEA
jgi:uncharacterized protein (DUF362 family)